MSKSETIRVRVSQIFRDRMARYIENERRRGRDVDEATVVRDAVIEYLDREEQRPELFIPGSGRANDLPPAAPHPRLVTPEEKSKLKQAVESTEAETANSPREHLDEKYAQEVRARHPKNPPK